MSVPFDYLLGKIITNITKQDNKSITFYLSNGDELILHHEQDCSETVTIDDINGKLDDLLHSPVTMATKATNKANPKKRERDDSYTWTFYKLATIKGYVDIRWYGSSNGWYSEGVNFNLLNPKPE